jgi:hypothetical protein
MKADAVLRLLRGESLKSSRGSSWSRRIGWAAWRDELRQAVAVFVATYNTQWLIRQLGHRTPKEAYQDATTTAARDQIDVEAVRHPGAFSARERLGGGVCRVTSADGGPVLTGVVRCGPVVRGPDVAPPWPQRSSPSDPILTIRAAPHLL